MTVDDLLARYYRWLRDRTVLKEGKDIVEITTPYLNAHNDYIQIYLKKDGENYILSDEGETIAELEMYGCSLETGKRGKILNSVLQGFGVFQKDGVIQNTASAEDFPLKKHCLVQALLSVNDMFFYPIPMLKASFMKISATGWMLMTFASLKTSSLKGCPDLTESSILSFRNQKKLRSV